MSSSIEQPVTRPTGSDTRSGLFAWFRPAPARPRLSEPEIKRLYPRYRWQVFEAAFIAYATFYIVRNNFAPVSKEIGVALGYDKVMIGKILLCTAVAYGIGKLVMGFFADRSDARKYVATGLLLTAGFNFLFGATSSYYGMLVLWTLNGFVQGMGYGPCTRGLAHFYSVKERGMIFGVWNTAHCVGGGVAGVLAAGCAQYWGWRSAFYMPGTIATICAFYLFWRMLDTPQAVGLPAIEEYKNDWPPEERESHERELTFREIFLGHILPNKMLWLLAFANIFVYIARYAMVDWGPTYLKEMKGASLVGGGMSTLVLEFSGGLGMLTMGWLSDKLGGRRARVSCLAMVPLLLAFLALIFFPTRLLWLNLLLFGLIGFFVYVPVMFSGVVALDLTSKKAQATAAGFVGCFGYVGGRMLQGYGIGWLTQHYGWNVALWGVVACILLGIGLLSLLWNVKPRG
ncbi:MAG TPA: MFS transporter [Candidatus Dormibacteraeota bacterium]|nr:MFS transporter [Candidatus Dormibacteraeota bacterium]